MDNVISFITSVMSVFFAALVVELHPKAHRYDIRYGELCAFDNDGNVLACWVSEQRDFLKKGHWERV